eukprot:gene2486-2789_t
MVEGHQCHRVGYAHRLLLLGKKFIATSPNGRFTEGAAAISGKLLTRVEVHGKNLFYFFGGHLEHGSGSNGGIGRSGATGGHVLPPGDDPLAAGSIEVSSDDADDDDEDTTAAPTQSLMQVQVVHIHFGMSGAFRTASLPGPEPTPTTRLRLEHPASGLMAHLSAMTVAHGDLQLYLQKTAKLGPDPLRPDADPEQFWMRVKVSKKPIGLLLMDQSAVAGVGNIYRAEILYKSGLHPEQPGYSVSRPEFDVLWGHCKELLQRGFESGSILTVDAEDAKALGKPWTRRYIYNQRQCGRCKGSVKSWDMAGRTVYCCDTCQPLKLSGAPSAGLEALEAAAAAVVDDAGGIAAGTEFVSHCAPDDPADLVPQKMTCAQLRDHLKTLNLDTRGTKPQLIERVETARVPSAPRRRRQSSKAAPGDKGGLAVIVDCRRSPSTAGIASASAAAAEKAAAGENKAVEHVALVADDWTEGMMFGEVAQGQQQQQHVHPELNTPTAVAHKRSRKRQRAG